MQVILEDMVHVTVIALFRYVILVHPRRLGVVLARRYSVVVILVIMYFVPLVLVLIQSFTNLIQTDAYHHGSVVFNRYTMFCSFVRHSEFQHLGVVKKFGVVSLCAAVVGFCYARIYFLVRHRGRRLSGTGGSFNHVRLHHELSLFKTTTSCLDHELSLLKTVVVIFLTFAVSYLPITVIYGLDTERTLPHEVYFVGVVLMWLSPSINWVVYGLMNAKFSRAYRYLLCGRETSTDSRQQRGSLACLFTIPLPNKPVAGKARRCASTPGLGLPGSERTQRTRNGSKLARTV